METLLKNALFRNLLAIVLGLTVVIYPQLGPNIIIRLIGAAIVLPSILSLIGYFSYKKKGAPLPYYVLIESGIALFFGIWLLLQPSFFGAIIFIALGGILLFAGISQLVSLIRSSQALAIPIGMYIVPVLVTIAGAVLLFNPFGTIDFIMITFGVSLMVYGIYDIVRNHRYRQ